MALQEPALLMQVFANEDLLATIMDNVDDPKTLFNLSIILPAAKATFERCPRQLLTAALSSLPLELQLLAILYIALKQDHVSRASMIPLLWDYLRLDDTPGLVEPVVAAVEFAMPRDFSNPFATLRKLAAVWGAVEDLAAGFVERSNQYIQACKAAETAGLEPLHYQLGRRLRPLSHLWNREIKLEGLPGYGILDKPQPWSMPLRASEVHRVKRALWRIEIFAVVSHEPGNFPDESAVGSGVAEVYNADRLESSAIPPDYDEGTGMLLASLPGSELAELESIYDYLWRETIGKAYQHTLRAHWPRNEEKKIQQAWAEGNGGMTSRNGEWWGQEHDNFQTQFAMKRKAQRAMQEHDRHLTYSMSLGLPFLHRVHQQILRDGNVIIPENYPSLRYRSLNGLRDTWLRMDGSRSDDIWRSYDRKLEHIKAGHSVTRRSTVWPAPEDYPGSGAYCAYGHIYVQTRSAQQFRVEDLWRAGCYMWERRQ